MKWQIYLAKQYGIYGFCFYHYWFKDGKQLLEKPIDSYLSNQDLEFPFCLNWANGPWNRRWDGLENELLMKQEYGDKKEWEAHFYYLLPFFKDKRYIRLNGKLIFVICCPDIMKERKEILQYWQELAIENNIGEISFICQFPEYLELGMKEDLFDYFIEFEPFYSIKNNKNTMSILKKINYDLTKNPLSLGLKIVQSRIMRKLKAKIDQITNDKMQVLFKSTKFKYYDDIFDDSFSVNNFCKKKIPGIFTDWDNTARCGKNAMIFIGSTPDKFKKYLMNKIHRVKTSCETDLIFINAWNEWAEGAYLEPDEKYGYSYLEAVKSALEENGYSVPLKIEDQKYYD